jgi:hypothetical protein
MHRGFASSHFFFLRRHVIQPVLDRPFAILLVLTTVFNGCFRGLPLGLLSLTGASDAAPAALSDSAVWVASTSSTPSCVGTAWTWSNRYSSSVGSNLGIVKMLSSPCSQCMSSSRSCSSSTSSSGLSQSSLSHDDSVVHDEADVESIMTGTVFGSPSSVISNIPVLTGDRWPVFMFRVSEIECR